MKYPTESSEIKETADWLFDKGANVLALTGKSAELQSWSHWEDERQSAKEKDGLPWHKADGVGVVSGINCWRCLDVDDCENLGIVLKILRGMGLPDNYRWVVKSGSREGFHIWFLCPDNDAFGGCDNWIPTDGQAFDHIEVRWKNHQTAMPPSIHDETGEEYIFPKMPPKSEPQEVSAEAVREGLRSVAKPKKTKVKGGRATSTIDREFDDPEVETIRSALEALPEHFGEDRNSEWLPMIMAVRDGAPDDSTAEALLKEWRPEWETGEYARVLDSLKGGPPEGVDPVTVATLFGTAQAHGWTFPDSDMPGYSLEDFEDDIQSLDIDLPAEDSQAKARLEYEASGLIEKAARMDGDDIEQAASFLRVNGARARKCRDWKGTAKEKRREQMQDSEEDGDGASGPQDLEHGELTAWIAGEVDDHFALDGSGALYYYDSGRYVEGGEDYLNQQVKQILDDAGMTKEFSRYRCEEVRHRVVTEAPELWEDPPRNRINLLNGILNLKTGEIEEHGPKKWLSTRQIPIAHAPEAEGTAWEDALNQWMPEDGGAELGYEIIAYNLMPGFGRRKATYLYGGKSQGKSSFLRNVVEGVFGYEGVEHMTLQEIDRDDYAAADLFGTALNVCADLPSEPMEGTSVFKRITGGDRISAQRKYKDRFNFTPHCNLIFSGNGPIIAPNSTEAFWDRWLVIPFRNNDFTGEERLSEDELDARLQDSEELSALLNEVLRVLQKVRQDGVTERPSMRDALHDIRMQPSNPKPPHVGDSTAEASKDGQTEAPSEIENPETGEKRPVDGGEPSTKDFEKERGLDTQGHTRGVSKGRSFSKDFSEGDAVKKPDGSIGEVREVRPDDTLVVESSAGPPSRHKPDALEAVDEAPF
ncbi:phage/plasmid primase, P4 family [Salinibacter ruber]|uniref:P4 family phage/plasmid primase-like protein n=1 Tax=Salinibacter ruber TaxID=146919 RepID=A0A9X2Q5R2_9BACT|nr:phage/plasmid primase, P4 family [Salinibacter ruber]MCS3662342.1 P4 family phage/plasmid primase-like protein [Salinibacter ruber]MCS3712129.1 P4 family phage/plasmid primase-like protein [Salinibacter ruber]